MTMTEVFYIWVMALSPGVSGRTVDSYMLYTHQIKIVSWDFAKKEFDHLSPL